jgi:hypothetical protein
MARMEDEERETSEAASGGIDQGQSKQQPVSSEGAANSPAMSGRLQGSSGRSREDEDLESVSRQANESETDLEKLQEEELSGPDQDTIKSASYSDTDEDENEGLGDGNLGRTVRGG